ncbi:MAG TPA: VOC family protein [Actinomycetota bacterium]|nr:VOC family protein [Actinomycetota bacterium]
MKLEGIHHITAITADAFLNVEFYAGVLGLRMVKKTVNQDDPTVYHLFYADEVGSAGADITFFEYPGAGEGRAGDGMVHRVVWRLSSAEALDFWEKRLGREGVKVERSERSMVFADPEGLNLEFVVDESGDDPLRAEFPDIPLDHALRGFEGVRAYSSRPQRSTALFEHALNFHQKDDTWIVRGRERGAFYVFDPPPPTAPTSGAGTVHHIAWASTINEHDAWHQRVSAAGASPTPVIDRFYFKSIYFREPSGVLFEIATLGPGFTVDEDPSTLGQALSLPPKYEHLRDDLLGVLTPLPDPRDEAGDL